MRSGGSVTFSALASLRGLPYRVVCVIGLDHDAFPGSERAAEFDLIAARPRPGDRQRRLDDRNLFLDLVLAARELLHLSHVGRSVRDGAALPPSVLVDELLDTLAAATAAEPARADSLAARPSADNAAKARRRRTICWSISRTSRGSSAPAASGCRPLSTACSSCRTSPS